MSKTAHMLKRATGKMKIDYMKRVLDFRREVEQASLDARDESTRHGMLVFLKENMDDFRTWYDKVYVLRRNNNMPAYIEEIETMFYLRKIQLMPTEESSNMYYTALLERKSMIVTAFGRSMTRETAGELALEMIQIDDELEENGHE